MNALERFLSYAVVHTASDRHNHEATPSTECQHILAKQIEEEMKAIGLPNVVRTEHAYVYGFLPATEGYEDRKCIGFNAHIDIVADLGIGEVKPQVIENRQEIIAAVTAVVAEEMGKDVNALRVVSFKKI